MTIFYPQQSKTCEKQLAHLKRMIDQELLKRDLLNNSENVQRIRYQKENITRF